MFKTVVLASGSPRRKELLASAGIAHLIIIPEVDETPLPKEDPADMVERLANRKARVVADAVVERLARNSSALIIAADTTVVSAKNKILGKPSTKKEALSMIRELQGKRHSVLTGYSVLAVKNGKIIKQVDRVIQTDVYMKKLNVLEIAQYVNRGESMDKAGAYAAQGFGMVLIEKIVGSYTNVVGLPISHVIEDMKKIGWKNERSSGRQK